MKLRSKSKLSTLCGSTLLVKGRLEPVAFRVWFRCATVTYVLYFIKLRDPILRGRKRIAMCSCDRNYCYAFTRISPRAAVHCCSETSRMTGPPAVRGSGYWAMCLNADQGLYVKWMFSCHISLRFRKGPHQMPCFGIRKPSDDQLKVCQVFEWPQDGEELSLKKDGGCSAEIFGI